MSYDNQLDARIHRFLERKEREHPELHESVDQLIDELLNPYFSNQLHETMLDKEDHKGNQYLNDRTGGLNYAL